MRAKECGSLRAPRTGVNESRRPGLGPVGGRPLKARLRTRWDRSEDDSGAKGGIPVEEPIPADRKNESRSPRRERHELAPGTRHRRVGATTPPAIRRHRRYRIDHAVATEVIAGERQRSPAILDTPRWRFYTARLSHRVTPISPGIRGAPRHGLARNLGWCRAVFGAGHWIRAGAGRSAV